jgi:hypothetical protein
MKQIKRPVSLYKALRPPLCDAGWGMAAMRSTSITNRGEHAKHLRLAGHHSILAVVVSCSTDERNFGCCSQRDWAGSLPAAGVTLPMVLRSSTQSHGLQTGE